MLVAFLALSRLSAESVYFPEELAADGWYEKFLVAMKEPPLYRPPTDTRAEQYRFLWLRSFHKGIAVRVAKADAGVTLRVVRVAGQGGYEPGDIEQDQTIDVTAQDWAAFKRLLEEADFWQLPREEKMDEIVLDGSQWILEGRLENRYHVVDRWTPVSGAEQRKLTDYAACCKFLLILAKVEIPQDELY